MPAPTPSDVHLNEQFVEALRQVPPCFVPGIRLHAELFLK